jgi:TetR/AcrR family transcriptional regulator, mexJK operon transcriptional repressor
VLFAAVIDSIVAEIVRPLPDIDALSLSVRATLILVAQQHMETVLSERHIALARLVAAEAARFPEVGRVYYEHGPARGHAKLQEYFARQIANGSLKLSDVRRAADYFWGMLLHHATLRRLYNVGPRPSATEIRSDSAAVVDAFLALYGAPSGIARSAQGAERVRHRMK